MEKSAARSPLLERLAYYTSFFTSLYAAKLQAYDHFAIDLMDDMRNLIEGTNGEIEMIQRLKSDIGYLKENKDRLIRHVLSISTRMRRNNIELYMELLKSPQEVAQNEINELIRQGMVTRKGNKYAAVPIEGLPFYEKIKAFVQAIESVDSLATILSNPLLFGESKLMKSVRKQAAALKDYDWDGFRNHFEAEMKLCQEANKPFELILERNPRLKEVLESRAEGAIKQQNLVLNIKDSYLGAASVLKGLVRSPALAGLMFLQLLTMSIQQAGAIPDAPKTVSIRHKRPELEPKKSNLRKELESMGFKEHEIEVLLRIGWTPEKIKPYISFGAKWFIGFTHLVDFIRSRPEHPYNKISDDQLIQIITHV